MVFFNGVPVVLCMFFQFFFFLRYRIRCFWQSPGHRAVSPAVQLLGPSSTTATPDSASRLSDAAPGGADFAPTAAEWSHGCSHPCITLRMLWEVTQRPSPRACPHLPSRPLGSPWPRSPPVSSSLPGRAAFPAASPLLSRHRANQSRVDLKCFSLFLEML